MSSTYVVIKELPNQVFLKVTPPGPKAPGVPAGGTAGQFLKKSSGTDFETEWATTPGPLLQKAGSVGAGSFTGSPLTYAVVFAAAFADANYSVSLIGADARVFTVETKTAAGFTINTNSAVALTGAVDWVATKTGEAT